MVSLSISHLDSGSLNFSHVVKAIYVALVPRTAHQRLQNRPLCGIVRSGWTKSDFYDGLQIDPVAGTIEFEKNNVRHDKLRSMMAVGVRDSSYTF
jgi:hypothetical protein